MSFLNKANGVHEFYGLGYGVPTYAVVKGLHVISKVLDGEKLWISEYFLKDIEMDRTFDLASFIELIVEFISGFLWRLKVHRYALFAQSPHI